MSQHAIYGEFNAEKYWRKESFAKLPEIPDNQVENIIKSMDELLFTLCSKDDTLITRYKIDPVQKEYLESIGFSFRCNNINISEEVSKEEKNKNICELMLEKYDDASIKKMISDNTSTSAFAVLPESYELSQKYRLEFDAPSIEVIKKVNSKIYSSNLNKRLNSKYPLQIVHSSEELMEEGMKYLNKSSIMLKDSFGVSGKGNLVISNEGILQRISKFVSNQENAGKSVEFIVEPFLDKEKDFSCQFFIEKSGVMEMLSTQEVRNIGSAYNGSYTPDKEFMNYITDRGYFSILKEVGEKLHQDGYYGDVCIDSMILKSGDIIPIVEINARKSMSLIKHNIDNYVMGFGLNCCFTFLNVTFSADTTYEQILEDMKNNNLLFRPGMDKGVIPLSANTLFINRHLDKNGKLKNYKGRLYLAMIYAKEEERVNILKEITNLLNKNQINVLS